jgi:hypothetical protein
MSSNFKRAFGNGGLSKDLIDRTHDEIDELRRDKGLGPWKWSKEEDKKMFQPGHKTVFKERKCDCSLDCMEMFIPSGARSKYANGHKPVFQPQVAKISHSSNSTEKIASKKEPSLDYKLALSTMQRELSSLDNQIEECDNEMEGFRSGIASMQMLKNEKVERHGKVIEAIEMMKRLIGETNEVARARL